MRNRTRALVGLLAACLLLAAAVGPSQAADPPLFVKGSTYMVVWDCVPEIVVMVAAQGGNANPCFTELLTVLVVRADGWLVVQDESSGDGKPWTVNPARALGIRVAGPIQQAAQ